jgi:CRP-like cAMP-binding protein
MTPELSSIGRNLRHRRSTAIRAYRSAYISTMPGADPSDLAALPLFESLSDTERAEVAGWFEVREVGAGVRLVGEGATGYSFFVIEAGEATVTAHGDEIATLRMGEYFGELALLGTGKRTASVTTTKPSRILVLFGNDFTRLRTRFPAVAAQLEAAVRRRLQRA